MNGAILTPAGLLWAMAFAAPSPSELAFQALARRGAVLTPLDETFYEGRLRSRCLGKEHPFALHLPPSYDQRHPDGWPLIVFLHGAGRDHRTLLHPSTRRALQECPAVVLLPNGDQSWWIDSGAAGRYQSHVLELMDLLREGLNIGRDAQHCAAGGWSMGGFGSANLVMDHPDRFGAWAALLALLDFPNDAYPPEHNHRVPSVLADRSLWSRWNPLTRAQLLKGKAILFLTAERAFDRRMNETFHQRLLSLPIPHEFAVVPGGHDFPTVAAHFPSVLRFLTERVDGEGD